ncbi:ROK family protein [Collinsella sp. An2]|uniref:ROK family protein n=1 Tax=Collinsella sp. An2 TaxID=1965585 RepID=UPI000B3B059D|nr:ROK family protein [Collinsella sp. An2]OUP09723.1 hypothetical protein B5F33_03805 [Collinsella sp. An2]
MARYFGIDAGGTQVKWAVVSDDYRIERQGSMPTRFDGADEAIDAFCSLVKPFKSGVDGIGISMPGIFSEQDPDGVVGVGGALHYLDGCPLGRVVGERTGLVTRVDNDAVCGALGEYAVGALKGVGVGVMVVIGSGIGGSIVIDGHVFRGAHGAAGGFSFMGTDASRPISPGAVFGDACSWRSLRDRICAEKGIESDESIDGFKLFSMVEAGDPAALRGLDAYARTLDALLMDIQAVVDPEVIVVGGGISRRRELFEALERQLDQSSTFPFLALPKIRQAVCGNDANIFGAVRTLRLALGIDR